MSDAVARALAEAAGRSARPAGRPGRHVERAGRRARRLRGRRAGGACRGRPAQLRPGHAVARGGESRRHRPAGRPAVRPDRDQRRQPPRRRRRRARSSSPATAAIDALFGVIDAPGPGRHRAPAATGCGCSSPATGAKIGARPCARSRRRSNELARRRQASRSTSCSTPIPPSPRRCRELLEARARRSACSPPLSHRRR